VLVAGNGSRRHNKNPVIPSGDIRNTPCSIRFLLRSDMKIDLRTIPEGYSEITCDSDLESVKSDLPGFTEKIRCHAEVNRSGPQIFMHLWYSGVFDVECSRCLNVFKLPLSGDIRLILREQQGRFGASLDDDEVDFYFDNRNDLLDISSSIYDEIMTNMPLKPLCSEDCKGIQLETGKETEQEAIDPRWEALRRLKKKE
jgi:uncharacterized protein